MQRPLSLKEAWRIISVGNPWTLPRPAWDNNLKKLDYVTLSNRAEARKSQQREQIHACSLIYKRYCSIKITAAITRAM